MYIHPHFENICIYINISLLLVKKSEYYLLICEHMHSLRNNMCPGQCGSLGWVLSHALKDCWLLVQSQVRVHAQVVCLIPSRVQLIDASFFPCAFLYL